LIQYQGQS